MSGPSPWKTNVMGVLGDCRVLFASVLCPALAYYTTSEQFESPPASVTESCIGGYCLCCGFLLRSRLREKYNLDGSILGDFLAHMMCHCVALARIWREAEFQADAVKCNRMQPSLPPPTPIPAPPMQAIQPYMLPPIQQQFIPGTANLNQRETLSRDYADWDDGSLQATGNVSTSAAGDGCSNGTASAQHH